MIGLQFITRLALLCVTGLGVLAAIGVIVSVSLWTGRVFVDFFQENFSVQYQWTVEKLHALRDELEAHLPKRPNKKKRQTTK